MIKFNI